MANMIVYKFGGASVKSSEGFKNILEIVSMSNEDMFIVISAMGKTTNAMEVILEHFMHSEREQALRRLDDVEAYHREVIEALFG